MKSETIKAIFTNLLFVIGVVLLIFGFITGTQTAVRMVTFDKYPLYSYEESRCEYEPYSMAPIPTKDGTDVTAPTKEEVKARQEKCKTSLEHDRRVRKTENIVTAITTLVAGMVLVLGFRRFIFK